MLSKLKKIFYFPIAYYFRFFAQIQLLIWKPKIIMVTGSNGKTTLLHLIESQIGKRAKYSHHANSAFGIPFNILGLERKTLTIFEWPFLFLLAPLQAFKKPVKERIYVVEADCDRPFEGKFLAGLLNPEITIWLSVSKTHTMNFPQPVEENIAKEFGYFLEYTKDYCIINGDSELIINQLTRTKSEVKKVTRNELQNYQVLKEGTQFKIDNQNFNINYLLPEDTFYLLAAIIDLLKGLDISIDSKFTYFVLPPGRSSIFKGIKNITIIDSSYNATPASMKVALHMYQKYPGKVKWAILSDMVELGEEEKIEHERLAQLIKNTKLDKVILMGPRMIKYTLPKVKAEAFQTPLQVLNYLKENIKGEEVLFFKGSRFLEGIIEHLLSDKKDVSKLCRREKVWQERRKKWGL